MAGIFWGYNQYNLLATLAITLLLLLVSFLYNKKPKNTLYTIPLIIIFYIGALRTLNIQSRHKNFYKNSSKETIDIIASIKSIQKIKSKLYTSVIQLQTSQKKTPLTPNGSPFKKRLQIFLKKMPNIKVDDTIKIKNIRIKKPNNQDFNLYLMKEGISTTLFKQSLDYTLIKRPPYSLTRWIHDKKTAIHSKFKKRLSPLSFSLFSSIFLGNRNNNKKLSNTLKVKFTFWGILHFLARSGLHLILFLLICEFILKSIPVCFAIKQIIALLIACIYLLLSWPSVSFLRAFSAFVLFKVCPFLNTKPDPVYTVALVCFSMTLYNPLQIFFLNFQLSFGLTFALALLYRIKTKTKQRDRLFCKKTQQSPYHQIY